MGPGKQFFNPNAILVVVVTKSRGFPPIHKSYSGGKNTTQSNQEATGSTKSNSQEQSNRCRINIYI